MGVVLAAGSGVRMGRPKAELRVAGERLVDRAVRALTGGGCAAVLAVVRAGVSVPGAQVVVNPEPERGMRSSLELAVAAGADADALAVTLVDMPGVTATGIRAVLAAWRPGRIAVAARGGWRGPPVVMAPALWRKALAVAEPDEGARRLLRSHPDLVDEAEVGDDPSDLDTPADLASWGERSS